MRRIREAGRPDICWMRSWDSCAHNNGNSSPARKGESSREGRQEEEMEKRGEEAGTEVWVGSWLVQVNFSGGRPENQRRVVKKHDRRKFWWVQPSCTFTEEKVRRSAPLASSRGAAPMV